MISPLILSSGDLIADRRFGFARDLTGRGDFAAAADLLAQALDITPGFAPGWFALGDVREKTGDAPGAIEAFRRALAADPQDRHGAALRLARLGIGSAAMPADYLRTLFDQYASGFDQALVDGLGYRGPQILLDAVLRTCRAADHPVRFGTALDLGCGTGLAGAVFRPHVDEIIGVDVSEGMIAQARTKDLYDRLHVVDLLSFLAAEARNAARYHLIVSADVFVYCENLNSVVAAVAAVLAPDGLLAFTTETHDGIGIILRDTLRFAHSEEHIRESLAAAGLTILSLDPVSTRTEKGSPVPGLAVVASAASLFPASAPP